MSAQIWKVLFALKKIADGDYTNFGFSEDWLKGAGFMQQQIEDILKQIDESYFAASDPITRFELDYLDMAEGLSNVNPVRFEQFCDFYKSSNVEIKKRMLGAMHIILSIEDERRKK